MNLLLQFLLLLWEDTYPFYGIVLTRRENRELYPIHFNIHDCISSEEEDVYSNHISPD